MSKTENKIDNEESLYRRKTFLDFLTATVDLFKVFSSFSPIATAFFSAATVYIKTNSNNKHLLPIFFILLILFLFFSLLSFIVFVINYLSNRNIQFYMDKNQGPKYWENKKILNIISRKKLNLLVVGRTNISWFRELEKLKKYYKKALNNNCRILFIIQHEDVKNSNIDNDTKEIIKNDYPETIKNYNELYKYLKDEKLNVKENFKLSLTKIPVNNSMTALYKTDGYYYYFSYDIDKIIKKSKNPYLVFRNSQIIDEMKYKLENIMNNSTDIFDYDVKHEEINDEINKLLKKYSLSSAQRENKNKRMLYHYFERKNCLEKNGFYPPVSVQLLITSKCTAKCIMCGHHLINNKNELCKIDIMNIIDYIHDIGTKNIIISGGEPLSRCDCIGILEYAKKKELNVGLITNGVKKNGESITLCEAAQVKKYCDWVQISIDSFDNDTYKQIRNIDLSIVKESLENLEAAGVNLEIVFTIQKLNIDEAIEMVKTGKTVFGFRSKVRFKFAHGPDKNNNFLLFGLSNKLDEFLKYSGKDINFYSEYFNEMIAKEYFTKNDILNGLPLYSLNRTFKKCGYVCHAVNYTCVIDAEGNIYPCCFLYDDNAGEDSTIRSRHYSGTLRSNGLIAPLSDGENKLKQVLSENYNRYSNYKIPFDEEACNYCTRHFYQNAFLNELDKIIAKYKEYKFDDLYPHEDSSNSKIWF
jgi:MoaA/NifB/PqqE/SkfB family radical SAM enzyme